MSNSPAKLIAPFKSAACAALDLPGSKSITNRAMLLAALSGGEVTLTGALFSRDTAIMASSLERLGYKAESDNAARTIKISGKRGQILNAEAEFFMGNAGTAARFITALVALKEGGYYRFDADSAMYKRPMAGLIEVLKAQGAEFEFFKEKNCFPFRMKTRGLKGGQVEIDASASSQLLSALLMVAPFAKQKMSVSLKGETVSKPFVQMTLDMMKQFGFKSLFKNSAHIFEPTLESAEMTSYAIEPDATAASYFAILPALTGGAVLLKNFSESGLQGDVMFVEALKEKGIVSAQDAGGSLLVRRGALSTCGALQKFDFNDISDTFLTLAAASAALDFPVKIGGIAHTRKQETDRVAAMAKELAKVCAQVEETEDSLTITPFDDLGAALKNKTLPIDIETYEDHRIAMSFGILGSLNALKNAEGWLQIENPACCGKTWAEFFDVLECARLSSQKFRVVAIDGGAAVGKSSVSKAAAGILKYMHVDTGSHYRTLACGLLKCGVTPSDVSAIESHLAKLETGTQTVGANSARMTINDELIEDALIRTKEVNDSVSVFASIPAVRDFLKSYQRSMADFARAHGFGGLIMEGRDIGSVIFPNADARIFLDADENTRQARRSKEGIADSIAQRDALDKARKTAPLVCPQGATLIDTSALTLEDVVARAVAAICLS